LFSSAFFDFYTCTINFILASHWGKSLVKAVVPQAMYGRIRVSVASTIWLLAWMTAACSSGGAQASVAEETSGQTRFQRTVQYLQDAPPELRGDFAAIALTNLSEAYRAEAQLARAETRATGHKARLGGWSAMVDYYSRQMSLLLADIELGLSVDLTLGDEQSLVITVADRTVIVSPPRLSQQSAFEHTILSDFCKIHSCEQFLPATGTSMAEFESSSVAMVAVRPNWSFSAQGPVCSYQGINVRFQSQKNLADSRQICKQFLLEVMTLSDELAWQQRHGIAIEWEDLDIQSTSHRSEHSVGLNAIGDAVLVAVPLLYRSPGLLQQVLPWIQRRIDNQEELSIDIHADLMGWQKP